MALITQRNWRILGAVVIGAAALMALYAVMSNILRDTVVAAVSLLGAAPPDVERTASGAFLTGYWALFGLLIAVALYLALIDLRYIRLQYLLEKRELFGRTVGDETFRRKLLGDSSGEDGDI